MLRIGVPHFSRPDFVMDTKFAKVKSLGFASRIRLMQNSFYRYSPIARNFTEIDCVLILDLDLDFSGGLASNFAREIHYIDNERDCEGNKYAKHKNIASASRERNRILEISFLRRNRLFRFAISSIPFHLQGAFFSPPQFFSLFQTSAACF